jgi:hypothetical protein
MSIVIQTDKNVDKRIYNKHTSNEIDVLIPAIGENNEPTNRDALVFTKNGCVKHIDTNKVCYDLLLYPLIFPTGQQGWQHNAILLNLPNTKKT